MAFLKRWKQQDLVSQTLIISLFFVFCFTWLPLLTSGAQGIFWRDLSILFYPAKKTWAEGFRALGYPPLWNSSILGGTPFLAECNWGSLNPFNFIFLLDKIFPFPLLFSWFLFLHHLILGIGAYKLGREFSGNRYGLLSAFFFLTNGITWSCLYMPHMLGTLSVLPFFFLWLFRAQKSPSLKNLFLVGALIGAPVIAGDPQSSLLFGIFAVLLIFQLPVRRAARCTLVLIVSSFLFSAPQLLPTLNLARESARVATGLSVEEVLWWSFHPMRVLEWIWPLGFGWQKQYSLGPDPGPFVLNTFIGVAPLLMVFLLRKKFDGKSRWLLLAVGFLFLLSLGANLPGDPLSKIVSMNSNFALFRYPERLLCFAIPIFLLVLIQRVGKLQLSQYLWSALILLQLVQFLFLKKDVFYISDSSIVDKNNLASLMNTRERKLGERFHSVSQSTVGLNIAEKNASHFPDYQQLVIHDWSVWAQNIPSYYGVDSISGFHTLQPIWYRNFWAALYKKPDVLYSLLGAKFLAKHNSQGEIFVQENPRALPYVFFPQHLIAAENVEDATQSIATNPNLESSVALGRNRIQENGLPAHVTDSFSVDLAQRGFGEFKIRVRSEKKSEKSVLVWNETYSKGWHVFVDGKEQELFRANVWAMGIVLPETAAGESVEVLFLYKEPLFWVGILCFGFWVLCFSCISRRSKIELNN